MAKLASANTHHQAKASMGCSQSSSSDAGSNSQGTVNINTDTRLLKSGGVTTNSGTFNIATNKKLSFGTSSVFNQNTDILAIEGLFQMNSDTFNFNNA